MLTMTGVLSLCTWLWAVGPLATLASSPAECRVRAENHYRLAVTQAGLAMAAAGDEGGLALAARENLVAVLCLLADADGCRQLRRELGRAPAAYRPLLEGPGLAPEHLDQARAFAVEVERLSVEWGYDRALARLGLSLLERVSGDWWRDRARQAAEPLLRKWLQRAASAPPEQLLGALLQAGQAAWLAMDNQQLGQLASRVSGLILRRGLPPVAWRQGAALLLQRGEAALKVLGRYEEVERLLQARARLETKALTPPELEFSLGPQTTGFECRLGAAARQWRRLWDSSPPAGPSRKLAAYFSLYAGLLARERGLLPVLRRVPIAGKGAYLSARLLGLAGRAYLLQGELWRATHLLERSAQLLGDNPRTGLLRAATAANAAQGRFLLGQYRRAAESFAALVPRLAGRPLLRYRVALGAAHARAFAGQLSRARQWLQQARQLLADVAPASRRRALLSWQLEEGLVLVLDGDRQAALASFARAEREARRLGESRQQVVALTNLAEILNDQGQAARALARARAALALSEGKTQPDAAWQLLTEQGRALVGLGRPRAAAGSFQQAIELVENMRARIGAEGARRSFASAKARLYRQAVALAWERRRHRQAFLLAERARGRAFLDLLAERWLDSSNPRLARRLRRWRDARLERLPSPRLLVGEPARSLLAGRSQAPSARPSADARQGWISLVAVNPAGVADVQAVLQGDELLVSFFHDGRRLLVMGLDRRGVYAAETAVTTDTLRNRVSAFLRVLRQPQRPERVVRRKAGRLYELLLGDLLAAHPARRLVVVPWGPLYYLPLAALHDGSGYLVDRVERLEVVPSASSLVMLRSGGKGATGQVLALGNPPSELPPLPAAEREVNLLGKMFAGALVRTGSGASKEFLLRQAKRARLIHLATHGVFLPGRPMESYLVLAADTPEVGHLRALDILQLDLRRTRLVMLSACETARAEVAGGEEIVGLSRAFFQAGARALVASLWPVDDRATAGLVEEFYRQWRQDGDAAAALVAAARRVKSREEFRHPFFWAAFQALGG